MRPCRPWRGQRRVGSFNLIRRHFASACRDAEARAWRIFQLGAFGWTCFRGRAKADVWKRLFDAASDEPHMSNAHG